MSLTERTVIDTERKSIFEAVRKCSFLTLENGCSLAQAEKRPASSDTGLFCLMAGVERIELPSAVLETVILPLYYTPLFQRINNSTIKFEFVNTKMEEFRENGKRSLSK